MRTFGAYGACIALLTASCMLNDQPRVAQGWLYTSGNPTYDAFFRDVHQQQQTEATWGDDKKGVHKALVANLELTPDAPDVTIVQLTHESASKVAKQPGSVRLEVDGAASHVVTAGGATDSSLFHAIEDTARQELERAKRLRAVEPKLDALTKQEAELEARVKADFTKYSETKANEVAAELVATRDVVAKMKAHAEAEARECEDFVADLGRALETASEEKAARSEEKAARSDEKAARSDEKAARVEPRRAKDPREKKKHEESASSGSPKQSAQTADQPPPPPPKTASPPPPPKPAETGEVFTP